MNRRSADGFAAPITAVVVCALALCLAVAPALASKPSANQVANKVLKLAPKKPADINLFASKYPNGGQGFYPQGSAMHPASGSPLTEAQARSKLKSYLKAQFHNSSAKVNAALALFDSQKAKTMIADPTLRAGFVGMKGTLLEPTINYFFNSGKFFPIGYAPFPDNAIAKSSGSDTQRFIFVNSRYASEDFRYLIGFLGHEVLHDDLPTPNAEEAINNSLSGMTYMQVLAKHPELAYKGTMLSREVNEAALAFINTREENSPNSEIFAPTGKGVAPGSPHNARDMWTFFGGNSDTSPAPTPLGQITKSLGLPKATKFSLATANTFAHLNDKWLSDVQRLQISVLLQLVSVKTVAKKAKLSRSKTIRKLHLKPYLRAIK
jgi:hypothetical protein